MLLGSRPSPLGEPGGAIDNAGHTDKIRATTAATDNFGTASNRPRTLRPEVAALINRKPLTLNREHVLSRTFVQF